MELAALSFILDLVVGTGAFACSGITITKFVRGIIDSKLALKEVRFKSDPQNSDIFPIKSQKEGVMEVYATLRKAEPYMRRIMTTLQIRSGIAIVLMLVVIYLLLGLFFAVVKSVNEIAFILAILSLSLCVWVTFLPNSLFKSLGTKYFSKLINDKKSGQEAIRVLQKVFYDAHKIVDGKISLNLWLTGYGSLSKYEIETARVYVTTLEAVRILEAIALRNSLRLQSENMGKWLPD